MKTYFFTIVLLMVPGISYAMSMHDLVHKNNMLTQKSKISFFSRALFKYSFFHGFINKEDKRHIECFTEYEKYVNLIDKYTTATQEEQLQFNNQLKERLKLLDTAFSHKNDRDLQLTPKRQTVFLVTAGLGLAALGYGCLKYKNGF